MAVNKRELELPEAYAADIIAAALEVDRRLQYDFGAAIEAANLELQLLREAELESGRRLHKGHPLHNLGVAWLRRSPVRSRHYFFGAHAEDVRLWPRLRPAHWPFLAERMLLTIFREATATIRRLERAARREPRRDPVELAQAVIGDIEPPRFPERVEDTLREEDLRRVPAHQRVFVGGAYGASMDRIDVIERAVRSKSFEPVVVAQYASGPDERPRPKSFRLLDHCAAAVFEGTVNLEPGWWPEIERIVQVKPVPTLVAYFAYHAKSRFHTSSMFPARDDMSQLEIQPWGTPEHLHAVVEWWLDRLAPPASAPPFVLEAKLEAPQPVLVPSGSPYLAGSASPYEVSGSTSDAGEPYVFEEAGEPKE